MGRPSAKRGGLGLYAIVKIKHNFGVVFISLCWLGLAAAKTGNACRPYDFNTQQSAPWLRDVMCPSFDFWFRCYIHCLLVYFVGFSTYPFFLSFSLLISSLTYLFLLRIDPLRLQAVCHKRRLNLALVFWVYLSSFPLISDCVLLCVSFSFFHTKPRDWLGETSPKWPI